MVIEAEGSTGGVVRIGSSVTVKDDEGIEETWSIVGRAEADATKGLISNESPVGKSLLGRKDGETVDVVTPVGITTYSIISVG